MHSSSIKLVMSLQDQVWWLESKQSLKIDFKTNQSSTHTRALVLVYFVAIDSGMLPCQECSSLSNTVADNINCVSDFFYYRWHFRTSKPYRLSNGSVLFGSHQSPLSAFEEYVLSVMGWRTLKAGFLVVMDAEESEKVCKSHITQGCRNGFLQ